MLTPLSLDMSESTAVLHPVEAEDTLPHVAVDARCQPRTAAYLILALQYQSPLIGGSRFDLSDLDDVIIGRGAELCQRQTIAQGRVTLHVSAPDAWMSTHHVRLQRVGHRWILMDLGSTNGTLVNGQRTARASLVDGDLLEVGNTMFLFRDGVRHGSDIRLPQHADELLQGPAAMATFSPSLQGELKKLLKFTEAHIPLLLHGESGTGKELVARMIHEHSKRPGEFVAVNCGALPESLIESELFGCRRGAFSGAVQDRPGLIRSAHKGTFFLDEIGELPEASQAALLRVLQEREVVPIGEVTPIRVNIRVVSATHRNLWEQVEQGTFRKDLYARLSGFEITLPPLRERREDLGLLITSILRRLCGGAASGLTLQPDAARALFAYDWPLNIRELQQVLSVAVTLADGKSIGLDHLPRRLRNQTVTSPERVPVDHEERETCMQLIALLAEHQGNISAVSRVMGKARVQIRRMCKRYSIDAGGFR